MESLGIEVTNADGALKPLPELIGHISGKLEGMGDAQKTATVAQLVGTEAASGFIALLETSEEGLASYTDELRNSSGVAQEMASIQQDNVNGALKAFQSALSEVGISVGNEFLPLMRDIVDQATSITRKFGELDMSTVALGLKMAGVASSVGLAGASLVKLGTTLGTLLPALGPAGYVIIGLAAAAAGAVYLYEQNKSLHEVNLDLVHSLTEQADALDVNVARYDELNRKSRLTTDEFGRLLDIQTDLNREQDPEKVAALQAAYDKLREKSGLTNDELSEMLGLNDRIIEQSPHVEQTFTDKGNAVITATDAVHDYINSLRDMAWEELQIERAKALENEAELLREQKSLKDELGAIETELNTLLEYRDMTEEQAVARLEEINEKKRTGLMTEQEIAEANNEIWHLERVINDELTDQLATLQERRKALAEKIALNEEELAKLNEIDEATSSILLRSIGVNEVGQEGVDIADEQLKKLKEQKAEIEEHIAKNGDQNGLAQEQLDLLNGQIGEHERILTQLDKETQYTSELVSNTERYEQQARHVTDALTAQEQQLQSNNSRIDEGTGKAKEMNSELEKDVTKEVKADDMGSVADIDRRASLPVTKRVSLFEQVVQRANLSRPQYHQGGLVGKQSGTLADMPKLHTGGMAREFLQNMPMHNEVDVRLLRNEMVLTEGQQANLFRMLNSGGTTAAGAGISRDDLQTFAREMRKSGTPAKIEFVTNLNGNEVAREIIDDIDFLQGAKQRTDMAMKGIRGY